MPEPAEKWLFRITHLRNLPHILVHGLCPSASGNQDPSFVPIGDQSLISVRKDLEVPIEPGGLFSEYVPFYLGARSPMLYQIQKGGEDVAQVAQSDIVYLVVALSCIKEKQLAYVFTDGHARTKVTRFYNSEADFDKLDWDTISARQWNNTEEDPDRRRRKQAELMVKGVVPIGCVQYLLTFDEASRAVVQKMVEEAGLAIPVHVKREFYF